MDRKNTDALWAIYELLEERLPKDGICGDEHTTTWSQPLLGIENETSVHVCVLTAGHAGLHRDKSGHVQWARIAEKVEPAPYRPEDDLDSLIASAHPEVRRHIEAVQKSVRVLLKRQNDDQAKIERLIRERDEAVRDVANVARDYDEQRDRYEELRGAIKTDPGILRLAAADIEAGGTGWGGLPRSLPGTLRGLADILARDDDHVAEPVDVTECRDCGRSDGGCDRVDTAPDVDPDERQSHPGVLWDKIDALTEDVERLTLERDKAFKEVENATKHASGWRRLHQELRADVVKHHQHLPEGGARECFDSIILRDDRREASGG